MVFDQVYSRDVRDFTQRLLRFDAVPAVGIHPCTDDGFPNKQITKGLPVRFRRSRFGVASASLLSL